MRRVTTFLILAVFVSAAALTPGTAARERSSRKAERAVESPDQSNSESQISKITDAMPIRVKARPADSVASEARLRERQSTEGSAQTTEGVIHGVDSPDFSRAAVMQDSASYSLDVATFSCGGATDDSSATYLISSSVGEIAAGEGESPTYRLTIGLWYSCDCPFQGDSEPDGFITALDLSACIDILFAGAADVQDTDCPTRRFDLDCDRFTTALDLAIIIDHLFASGDGPCDPCGQ